MRILSFSKFRRGGRGEVNMRGDSSFWILKVRFFSGEEGVEMSFFRGLFAWMMGWKRSFEGEICGCMFVVVENLTEN